MRSHFFPAAFFGAAACGLTAGAFATGLGGIGGIGALPSIAANPGGIGLAAGLAAIFLAGIVTPSIV
jgi:hypothetical protein